MTDLKERLAKIRAALEAEVLWLSGEDRAALLTLFRLDEVATLTDAQAAQLREAAQKVPDVGTPEFEWYSFGQLKRLGFRAADGEFLELAKPATILALLDERDVMIERLAIRLSFMEDAEAERDALRAERDDWQRKHADLLEGFREANKGWKAAAYARNSAEADAARLRMALEPFAKSAIDVSGTAACGVTLADIENARSVYYHAALTTSKIHDDRCATRKGYPCNCAYAALTTKGTAE